MLRLRTLGSVFVADERGEPLSGAAAQRRVIALLSLLAVAGDGGLSRDKIVGVLWPDSEPERARHSLTQTMYAARRALAVDDLFDAGSDVRLNATRIASDVRSSRARSTRGGRGGGRAVPGAVPRRLLPERRTRVRAVGLGAARPDRGPRAPRRWSGSPTKRRRRGTRGRAWTGAAGSRRCSRSTAGRPSA